MKLALGLWGAQADVLLLLLLTDHCILLSNYCTRIPFSVIHRHGNLFTPTFSLSSSLTPPYFPLTLSWISLFTSPPKNWLILSIQTLSFSLAWHVCGIFSNLMFELLVGFNRLVVPGESMISSSQQLLPSWWINQQFTPLLAHVNLILWMLSCHTTEQSLRGWGFWHE